eukprot:scaffold20819_cov73-Attheya_sp.AAC.1
MMESESGWLTLECPQIIDSSFVQCHHHSHQTSNKIEVRDSRLYNNQCIFANQLVDNSDIAKYGWVLVQKLPQVLFQPDSCHSSSSLSLKHILATDSAFPNYIAEAKSRKEHEALPGIKDHLFMCSTMTNGTRVLAELLSSGPFCKLFMLANIPSQMISRVSKDDSEESWRRDVAGQKLVYEVPRMPNETTVNACNANRRSAPEDGHGNS